MQCPYDSTWERGCRGEFHPTEAELFAEILNDGAETNAARVLHYRKEELRWLGRIQELESRLAAVREIADGRV